MHLADLPKCYMQLVFSITYNSYSRLPYLNLGISWSISPDFVTFFLGFWNIFFENEECKMPLSFLKSQWVGCQMSDHMLIWEIEFFNCSLTHIGQKGWCWAGARVLYLKITHWVLMYNRLSSSS